MPAFTSGDVTLNSTAAKILDSAEFDRRVVLVSSGSSSQVGYSNSSLASVFMGGLEQELVVPAGHELWGAAAGTGTLAFVVGPK